jgi:hypothetical protein
MTPLLERRDKWDIVVKTLGDSQGSGEFEYFGFIMRRR